jgi:hypothetical protein
MKWLLAFLSAPCFQISAPPVPPEKPRITPIADRAHISPTAFDDIF